MGADLALMGIAPNPALAKRRDHLAGRGVHCNSSVRNAGVRATPGARGETHHPIGWTMSAHSRQGGNPVWNYQARRETTGSPLPAFAGTGFAATRGVIEL
jgi:hypothetical protein